MAKSQNTGKYGWTEVNPAGLSKDTQRHYQAVRNAFTALKAAKETFYTAFVRELEQAGGLESAKHGEVTRQEGEAWIVGYNFGKLSVDVIAGERKAASSAPAGGATLMQRKRK